MSLGSPAGYLRYGKFDPSVLDSGRSVSKHKYDGAHKLQCFDVADLLFPSGKGKMGTIRCTISPVNACNSVSKNYTCTITQANVTAVTGNSNIVNGTAQ